MKNFVLVMLSAASLASAQNRPIIEASGGLTLPEISGEGDFKEQTGWNIRFGGGIAIPMNPQFEALLTGQFAMAEASGKESDDGYSVEIALVPKFIELDATALWKASPQFGLLGGLVMSIPMGGTYELEVDFEDFPEENISEDGDIDDFADDWDADINTFSSLKLGGMYFLDERKSIQVAYLMPLGKYVDGNDFGIKIARLVAGISIRL